MDGKRRDRPPISGTALVPPRVFIPKTGWVARFKSTEEAERVMLAAGFKFVAEEKGFRA
jgi:hypothetical protein